MGQLGDFIWNTKLKQGTGNIYIFLTNCISRCFLKLLICGEHDIISKTVIRGVKKSLRQSKIYFKTKTIIFHDSGGEDESRQFPATREQPSIVFHRDFQEKKHIICFSFFLSFFLSQCICKTSGLEEEQERGKER